MSFWSGLSIFASSILFICQFLDDLSHLRGREVFEVAIPYLHCRSHPASSEAFGKVPTELAIRAYLSDFNAQPLLYLIRARIRAHQPATDVATNLKVIFADRFFVEQRVKGRNAQHVRWRVIHERADVIGYLLRNPAELVLSQLQHHEKRGALFRIMFKKLLIAAHSLFAEFNHRSSSPATTLKLPSAATASASRWPSIILGN